MKKWFFILAAIFFFDTLAGQDRDELERRKELTQNEIEQARALLERTSRTRQNNLNRVSILNKGIHSRNELIRLYEEEISEISDEIESLEMQIDVLEEDIRKGKDEYAEIIEAAYKNNTSEDKVMYLLASDDLNQFYQRIKYLNYLTRYRERKVGEIKQLISGLESQKNKLADAKAEKLSVIEQKEEESRVLSRERRLKTGLIARLKQDESRLRKELREKERIKNELEEKIRAVIAEAARAAAGTSIYSTLTPAEKLVGRNFNDNKGGLPWPVEKGLITAEFGVIDHPVLSGVKINNNGIDISSAPGTAARCVFDGEVSKIFAILGANYTVIVKHGEFLSVYQNLTDLKVKVGDKVNTKDILGKIHSENEAEAAILHFQIWKEREMINPQEWISK